MQSSRQTSLELKAIYNCTKGFKRERGPESGGRQTQLETEGQEGETGLGTNNLKTAKAATVFSSCGRTHEVGAWLC